MYTKFDGAENNIFTNYLNTIGLLGCNAIKMCRTFN